jgi:LysM repeat protein
VAAETGEYTVQRGDTLALIARRFGTSVWALQQANPAITNPNHIWPGQRLVIPLGGEYAAPRTHRVQYGETLTAIAWRYGTTVWAIVVRNNLANPNLIYAGQVLVIP